MALDGEIKDELGHIKTALFKKFDELEVQAKKRGEDAVTKDEAKKLGDAIDALKDRMAAELKKKDEEINALHRKANRPPVASLEVKDAKAAALEAKANREFARWTGVDGASAAKHRAAYEEAFGNFIRKGRDALLPDELKTLSVGSAPDQGYYIEPFRANTLIDKLYETSDLRRAGAMQLTISGPSYEEPIDRDEAETGWVGEQTTRAETGTPQIGKLVVPVHEQYAMPKATQALLDMNGFNVEGWLDMKVQDQMGRQENTAFVTGNGTNKPKGFASYATAATNDASRAFGTIQHVIAADGAFKTATPTVNPADDLIDLIGKFKAGYRSRLSWGGTRVTLSAVRKFKDQNGNYIYDASVSDGGVRESILGYRWDEFADMADYTTSGALGIVLADWQRAYVIIDGQGIRQLRDPFTQKGFVLFYTYKRVGGAVRDSDALKFIKFAAA